uniref:Putative secreted protein n=1 Tax=Anopheles darlingi TaxID=43151 RepID=A0A2M4D3A7_ANODA
MYTRSDLFTFLYSRSLRISFLMMPLFSTGFTCAAASNMEPSVSAISFIEGSRRQQTRVVQEPDIPWHLQTFSILERNIRRAASLL